MKSEMLKLPVRETEVVGLLRNDPITDLIRKEFPVFFLVGGYIRDLFLGRIAKDRDYVVTGNLDHQKVKRLSARLGGSFFILKNLVRFVAGDHEIDITFIEDSIEGDISKRDFTINSLAWSPEQGIIDLYGGLKDIEKKVIRALSKENLISDPLRILRAYRLAAEIEGTIDQETRGFLSELRFLLKDSARERITSELIRLFNSEKPAKYLKMSIEDKILQLVFDVKEKDIINNFKFYKKFLEFYKKNKDIIPQRDHLSQGFSLKGFIGLVWLSYKKGEWLVKLSKKNQKTLEILHRTIKVLKKETMRNKKRLFELFYDIKDFPESVGLLFSSKKLLQESLRFKGVLEKPVIKGIDILKDSNIKSPHIGVLLKRLWALQFSNKIKTKEEALKELYRLKKGLK